MTAPVWINRIVEGWNVSGIFSWNSGQPLSILTTRRTVDSRANINTPDLVGVLPDGLGKVRQGDGFVEYFNGLSTQRASAPNFGGNTTVAGRFSNQVLLSTAREISFFRTRSRALRETSRWPCPALKGRPASASTWRCKSGPGLRRKQRSQSVPTRLMC
ncbi:MAG: hypothetical protein DMG14_24305 [Acidobacteria bacterium]|nr:MAG: hypothetical protein DMG14_24305 [Acidobacteriota bacterium]